MGGCGGKTMRAAEEHLSGLKKKRSLMSEAVQKLMLRSFPMVVETISSEEGRSQLENAERFLQRAKGILQEKGFPEP